MVKAFVKPSLFVLKLLLALIAALCLVAAALVLRLERGPITLSWFIPMTEVFISKGLAPDSEVEMGGLVLERDADANAYRLHLRRVQILGPDGELRAAAPAVAISFAVNDFFSPRLGPSQIVSREAFVLVVRDNAQSISVPALAKRRSAPIANFLNQLLGAELFESALAHVELKRTQIKFVDEGSNRDWFTKDGAFTYQRHDEGFDANLEATLNVGGTIATLEGSADFSTQSGAMSIDVAGHALPIGDILGTLYGERATLISAPVTGKAGFVFSREGRVLSAAFSAEIGEGRLRVGGPIGALDVQHMTLDTTFDPERNVFDVALFSYEVEQNRAELGGVIDLDYGAAGITPSVIRFDLRARDMNLDSFGVFEAPLDISQANARGAFDVNSGRFSLASFDALVFDNPVSGSFSFQPGAPGSFKDYHPDPMNSENAMVGVLPMPELEVVVPDRASPAIEATLNIGGTLDHKRLLQLWPVQAASGARDWVAEKVSNAEITNISGKIDLPMGAVDVYGRVPDEAVSLTFDTRNVNAYYHSKMKPIMGAHGSGEVRGNSFKLIANGARVGRVRFNGGAVEFPTFVPKWQPTYYRFDASGDAKHILGLLDQKPLSLLSKISLSPDQFSGNTRVKVTMMRPNKRTVPMEELSYEGYATFSGVTAKSIAADADFYDMSGRIDLRARSLSVAATGQFAEMPLELEWHHKYYRKDGDGYVKISGTADSSFADHFGIASRQYLRGDVPFSAKFTGQFGAFRGGSAQIDLSAAALSLPQLGWRKQAGVSARSSLTFTQNTKGLNVDELSISGDGIDVRGRFSLDADSLLQHLKVERFYLGDAADISVDAQRTDDRQLDVVVLGKYLNFGDMIAQRLGGDDRALSDKQVADADNARESGAFIASPLKLLARIDALRLRNGVIHKDATADFFKDANKWQNLSYSALEGGGTPISMSLVHLGAEDGNADTLVTRVGDVGQFLAGVFGLKSVKGGEGVVELTLPAPTSSGLTGTFDARDITVVDAPILAKLVAAGSLSAIGDLLGGEGIEFATAHSKFGMKDGVLRLDEARASGSAIGITARGDVQLSSAPVLKLTGAIAPLFGVNAFLQDAPILGDILIGKKGEGVIALSYSVDGPSSSPTLSVNPLSALTPGVFRQIFEGAPEPAHAREAAEVPAGVEETELSDLSDAPVANAPANDNDEPDAPQEETAPN